jgi:hypothetical protein
MPQMTLDEKEKAIREQYRIVEQAALTDIPKEYHGFLVFLERNVKIKHYKEEHWVNGLRTPYFMVAGRLKMAHDEHKKADVELFLTGYANTSDAAYQFETEIPILAIDKNDETIIKHKVVVPPHSYVAIFASPMRGVFDGISGINYSKKSPDGNISFALEDAETSAIGRALAKAGYGIVTSVASVEEMARYLATGAEDMPETEEETEKIEKAIPIAGTSDGFFTREQLEGFPLLVVKDIVKKMVEDGEINPAIISETYRKVTGLKKITKEAKEKLSKKDHIDAYLSLSELVKMKAE